MPNHNSQAQRPTPSEIARKHAAKFYPYPNLIGGVDSAGGMREMFAEHIEAAIDESAASASSRSAKLKEALTGAADELGNMLFRFDTICEALRQAVALGGVPLSDAEARKKTDAMLATANGSRAKLVELNRLLADTPEPASALSPQTKQTK